MSYNSLLQPFFHSAAIPRLTVGHDRLQDSINTVPYRNLSIALINLQYLHFSRPSATRRPSLFPFGGARPSACSTRATRRRATCGRLVSVLKQKKNVIAIPEN